jgi:hypothetical protein
MKRDAISICLHNDHVFVFDPSQQAVTGVNLVAAVKAENVERSEKDYGRVWIANGRQSVLRIYRQLKAEHNTPKEGDLIE